jgi:hypothetical protein
MERFKNAVVKLESEVAELKQFQAKIQGSLPLKTEVHYCTPSQEFGEYPLDEELDTFRFKVIVSKGANNIDTFQYTLLNPTPELSAYLKLQQKTFSTEYIPKNIDEFEEYCMEKAGTPFVLTKEIRKCLECKIWEFASDSKPPAGSPPFNGSAIRPFFYTDITIPFTHAYKILPHVSFYITPLSFFPTQCSTIHEITLKQVVFRIRYDSNPTLCDFSNLKLHYSIGGIVVEKNPDFFTSTQSP